MADIIVIGTHDGEFHADDVIAVAQLNMAHEGKCRLLRTRDPQLLRGVDIRVDVGRLYSPPSDFDHHQGLSFCRPNGIPYASAGLVGLYLKDVLYKTDEIYNIVDRRILSVVDAIDNGVQNTYDSGYGISDIIRSFRPSTNKLRGRNKLNIDFELDHAFRRAVDFCVELIESEIIHAEDWVADQQVVSNTIRKQKGSPIIVFPRSLFWQTRTIMEAPEALFVVMPDEYGENWIVNAVPVSLRKRFEPRKLFPRAWAGKEGKELAEVTGIPDAFFCHIKRFHARARTKESAVALAEHAAGDADA